MKPLPMLWMLVILVWQVCDERVCSFPCLRTPLIIALGHSFGGATTVLSLTKDTRFKVGIALDAWLFPLRDCQVQVDQPLLFISTGEDSSTFVVATMTLLLPQIFSDAKTTWTR